MYVTWLIVSAICSLMETGFLYNNFSLVHYTEGESGIGFPLSSGGAYIHRWIPPWVSLPVFLYPTKTPLTDQLWMTLICDSEMLVYRFPLSSAVWCPAASCMLVQVSWISCTGQECENVKPLQWELSWTWPLPSSTFLKCLLVLRLLAVQ